MLSANAHQCPGIENFFPGLFLSAQSHLFFHLFELFRRHLLRDVAALVEDLGEHSRILLVQTEFALNRSEHLDDSFCDGFFEVAVALALELDFDFLHRPPSCMVIDRHEVGYRWSFLFVIRDAGAGVGDGAGEFLADDVRRIAECDVAGGGGSALRHFGGWIVERHDARADFLDEWLGNGKGLAEFGVEAARDDACEFQVLELILTDRNDGPVIEQDVASHERWIGEEADGDVFSLLDRLVFVLRHAFELRDSRDRAQNPAEFRVSSNFALDEDVATGRVDADSKVGRCDVEDILMQLLRILGDGNGMKIDHAKEAAIAVLDFSPLLERANVVANMEIVGRLYARDEQVLHRYLVD